MNMNIYTIHFVWERYRTIPKTVYMAADNKETAERMAVETLKTTYPEMGTPIVKSVRFYRKVN